MGLFGIGGPSFEIAPFAPELTNVSKYLQDTLTGADQGGYQQVQQMYQNMAQGNGPSVAQNALSNALAQNQANTAAAMRSQKGISPGLAAALAARQGGEMGQQAAGQGALLRSNEQLGAIQGLGSTVNQAYNARTNAIGTIGGLQLGQGSLLSNNYNAANQINANATAGDQQILGNLIGSVIGAGGKIGAAAAGGGKAHGGVIDGKANVPGDSPKNDTVHAMLSPGEVVLPRTIAKDGEKAKAFVEALKKQHSGKDGSDYGKVLMAHKKLKEKVDALEKYCYGGQA